MSGRKELTTKQGVIGSIGVVVGAIIFVFLATVVAAGVRNLWLWMTGVC